MWLMLDMFVIGKVNAASMINGMIAGLVAITPAPATSTVTAPSWSE